MFNLQLSYFFLFMIEMLKLYEFFGKRNKNMENRNIINGEKIDYEARYI